MVSVRDKFEPLSESTVEFSGSDLNLYKRALLA